MESRKPEASTVPAMLTSIASLLHVDAATLKQGRGGVVVVNSKQIQASWSPNIQPSFGQFGQVDSVAVDSPDAHQMPDQELLLKAVNRKSAQAFFDPKSQTTYFVADRIQAGTEAAVFLHEITHKYGKTELGLSRWKALVGHVRFWASMNPLCNERLIFEAARRRVQKARTPVGQHDDELFAYAVEEAVKMGIKPSADASNYSAEKWLQTVVESIERVQRKLTGNDAVKLDLQDVVDLSYALAQLETPAHTKAIRRALDKANNEFAQWFKRSKVRDADGRPLPVYHGTYADFDTFKKRTGDIGMHFGSTGAANDRVVGAVPHRGNKDGKTLSASVYPVYLNIVNPLRLKDSGFWNAENMKGALLEMFPQDAGRIGSLWGRYDGLQSTKDIREFLQSKGYDGVVYKNTGEVAGADVYRERIAVAEAAMLKAFGVPFKRSFSPQEQQAPEYKDYSAAIKAYADYRESAGEDSFIAFESHQIKSVFNNGDWSPKDRRINFSLTSTAVKPRRFAP